MLCTTLKNTDTNKNIIKYFTLVGCLILIEIQNLQNQAKITTFASFLMQ